MLKGPSLVEAHRDKSATWTASLRSKKKMGIGAPGRGDELRVNIRGYSLRTNTLWISEEENL